MDRKLASGVVVALLLMSFSLVSSVSAVNDYDILIEVIPGTISLGNTVTFRIHADLVGWDDSLLSQVSVQGYTNPGTGGMYVIYPDGTSTHYRNDLSPIIIVNGVPSEALDYVDVTFGTNAPDKNDWDGPSTTDLNGLYIVDFSGFLTMTDGSVHWFDIFSEFTVTPPDGDWEGYTPGWWKNNARKLLEGRTRGTQITLEDYVAAVDCVYTRWSSDLDWLPTTVEEAHAILDIDEPNCDHMIKSRIHILAFLLTICHFGEESENVMATGPLGTYSMSIADWADFIIGHYNAGNYEDAKDYADILNNM